MKTSLAVLLLSVAAFAQNPEEGKVVRYELKPSELKYTYAASYTPVAHLGWPCDRSETKRTLHREASPGGVDCLGDRFEADAAVVETGDGLDEVLEGAA
jgi:hypothetical protein